MGLANHQCSPSLYGHAGGALAVVSNKLLMVGGRDVTGDIHSKAEYLDNGLWLPVDDNVTLSSFKLTRPCLAGWQSSAFLLGGDDYGGNILSYIWKLDFEKSPLKWEKHSHLLNGRHAHGCAIIRVKKEPYIVTVGGLSNEYETNEAKVIIFYFNFLRLLTMIFYPPCRSSHLLNCSTLNPEGDPSPPHSLSHFMEEA